MDLRRLALVAAVPLALAMLVDAQHDGTTAPSVVGDQAVAPPRAVVSPPAAERRRAQPAAPVVVAVGDGELHLVAGRGALLGAGPVRRYSVQVEGGLGVDPVAFAREVEATLSDQRSWGHGGRGRFQRVDSGRVDFRVSLASPTTVDRLCAPMTTEGQYSCAQADRAIINVKRWLTGAQAYTGDLAGYRHYVVNHEVGHVLGRGHVRCPAKGEPAPVMVQQTIGLDGCVKSPWPFP